METLTLSKIEKLNKNLIRSPDTFFVEEIDSYGNVYEINKEYPPKWENKEKYVIAVLQKKNWSTIGAIKRIAKKLRISKKRISFAGEKDKNGTTTQLISIYNIKTSDLDYVNIKDIKILGKWYWDNKLKLGDLLGNRFKIKISLDTSEILTIGEILEDLNSLIPNYFGPQRFGIRKNNHIVGKLILLGKYKDAVIEYLTTPKPNEDYETKKVRNELKKDLDFKKAIKEYPSFLKKERMIIEHLLNKNNDYIGALRKLQKTLLLFIHSYQSFLFNKLLARRIKEERVFEIMEGEYFCGLNWYSFPDIYRINGKIPVGKLIGYETKLNEDEKEILEEEGIKKEDFKVRAIPEISSKGGYRPFLVPIKDLTIREDGITFELPAGSYATVALREFFKVVN